jgi:hypothetical protein
MWCVYVCEKKEVRLRKKAFLPYYHTRVCVCVFLEIKFFFREFVLPYDLDSFACYVQISCVYVI